MARQSVYKRAHDKKCTILKKCQIFTAYCHVVWSYTGSKTLSKPVREAHTLEKITADELSSTLRAMKCGKARDDAGVIIELIKSGSDKLREAILHLGSPGEVEAHAPYSD